MVYKKLGFLLSAIFSACNLSESTNAQTIERDISTKVIKGYKFFDSETGEHFIVKGIDYYPRTNSGELDDHSLDFYNEKYRHIWERDIIEFKKLGINAIRLYAVEPSEDHETFMCALNEAGIYVMVGLGSACKICAVTRDQAPDCYPKEMKHRSEDIIREFAKYSNTLAFSAGNEVNYFVPLGERAPWNAPCLKKFVRDMRAYIDGCSETMRHIPVGIISADLDRHDNAAYYNCLTDPNDELEHIEWYGINSYVMCDGKVETYDQAYGFDILVQTFRLYNYSIPVMITEFGCLSQTFPTVDGYPAQRYFHQAEWFGSVPAVRDVFSGGFVFEYSIEKTLAAVPFPFKEFGWQNFGVGYFSPVHCDDIDIPCEYVEFPCFDNLRQAYANAVLPPSEPVLTFDTFEIDPYRTKRSKCPPDFAVIRDYIWEADTVESRSCPSTNDMHFTCHPAARSAAMSKTKSVIYSSKIYAVLFIGGFVIAILVVLELKNRSPSPKPTNNVITKDNDIPTSIIAKETTKLLD